MPSIELLESTHSNAFNQTKNTLFLLLGEKLLKNKRKNPQKKYRDNHTYVNSLMNSGLNFQQSIY